MRELLLKSLESIDKPYRQLLFDEIKRIAKENSWVKQRLEKALDDGMRFGLQHQGAPASYKPHEKMFLIYSELVKNLPINEKTKQGFEMIFKHEITHASDLRDISNPTEKNLKSYFYRMQFYADIADDVLNFVSCVRSGKPISSVNLEKFKSVIPPRVLQGKHLVFTGKLTDPNSQQRKKQEVLKQLLKTAGFRPDMTDTNITEYVTDETCWSSLCLEYRTANPLIPAQLMETLFIQLRQKGMSKPANILAKFNDTVLYEAFSGLSPDLQNILDILLVYELRVLDNVFKDEICHPSLLNCMRQLQQECLSRFLNCQMENRPEFFYGSLSEIHATLRERFTLEGFQLGSSLSEVCKSSQAPKETAHTTPSVFFAFSFSFCSSVVDLILNKLGLSSWTKVMLKPCIQTALYVMLGGEVNEAVLVLGLSYMLNMTAKYINLGQLQYKGIAINIIDALLILPQFRDSYSAKSLVAALSGNILGSNIESLGKFLLFRKAVEIEDKPKTFAGLAPGFLK